MFNTHNWIIFNQYQPVNVENEKSEYRHTRGQQLRRGAFGLVVEPLKRHRQTDRHKSKSKQIVSIKTHTARYKKNELPNSCLSFLGVYLLLHVEKCGFPWFWVFGNNWITMKNAENELIKTTTKLKTRKQKIVSKKHKFSRGSDNSPWESHFICFCFVFSVCFSLCLHNGTVRLAANYFSNIRHFGGSGASTRQQWNGLLDSDGGGKNSCHFQKEVLSLRAQYLF